MNSFNFFSSYHEAGKIKNRFSTRHIVLYVAVLVAVCVLIYGVFLWQQKQLKSQLNFLAGIKTDPAFNARYTKTLQLAKDSETISKDIVFLDKLEDYSRCTDTADLELKKLIDSCIPQQAFLDRVAVIGLHVSVSGHADSIDTILEIEKKFRATKKFASVLTSVIEDDNNLEKFGFTCQMILDGGAVKYE